jgi:hypothetical protein
LRQEIENSRYGKNYYPIHKEHRQEYNATHREQINELQKDFIKNNPEIIKAQNYAHNHFIKKLICQFGGCYETKKLEFAHIDYEDYKNPNCVLTMCIKHHKLIDSIYRE